MLLAVKTAISITLQLHTMVDESSKHRDLGVFGVCGEDDRRFDGTFSSSLSGSVDIAASSSFTDSLQLATHKFWLTQKFIPIQRHLLANNTAGHTCSSIQLRTTGQICHF